MELEPLAKRPTEITPVWIEAVLMPNGEIISFGKTIGWFDTLEKHLLIIKK